MFQDTRSRIKLISTSNPPSPKIIDTNRIRESFRNNIKKEFLINSFHENFERREKNFSKPIEYSRSISEGKKKIHPFDRCFKASVRDRKGRNFEKSGEERDEISGRGERVGKDLIRRKLGGGRPHCV